MNKKSMIIYLMILAVVSITANVYSFNKLSNEESEINKRNSLVLLQKEEELEKLKEENEILKTEKENTNIKQSSQSSKENETSIEGIEVPEVKEIPELENAAERFIDYSFNVNEENYATVKNNAENYMTDDMVETLFASDGISEEDIKLKTTVEEIEVFTANEDEGKAVVQYEITLDYGNGYKENLKPFVLLHFVSENGKLKVSKLQAINDIGGI
ncbi:MAG: hypothetical protein WBF39_00415 [Planococcus donghaensis]